VAISERKRYRMIECPKLSRNGKEMKSRKHKYIHGLSCANLLIEENENEINKISYDKTKARH